MAKKKTRVDTAGRIRISIEEIEGEPDLHDYGISRQAWIRGAKLMKRFGSDKALALIDQRAERAADRGDYEAARRWRDLITAIHAIEADERYRGDSVH